MSDPQKADWKWFKEHWDAKMLQEHQDEWPKRFAEWMQKVLDDVEKDSAAVSRFVHTETVRCFSDKVALAVPGHG